MIAGAAAVAGIAVAVGVATGRPEATGVAAPASRPGVEWPSFRGPSASGVSEGGSAPVRWSVARSEGILWKTRIPGLGHSSPVVWGDKIFVTSAIGPAEDAPLKVGLYGDIAPVPEEGSHRFMVYCLDKATGKILWERAAFTGPPRIKRHTKSSHANPTPATNGRHLIVFFGSEGLYAYDMQGQPLWKVDLGTLDSGYYQVPQAQWGFGSSPVIHEDRAIVQCDVQGGGFLAAVGLSDGKEIWRTKRDDVPTWSTPTVHRVGARTQVVANGWKRIAGYDAATGQEMWWMRGGGDIPVPTPVVAHGLIFISNAHGGSAPVYAIRTEAAGEIRTEEGSASRALLAWSDQRAGAYMQTPLVYGDQLYICRDNGQLTVFDAKAGGVLHKQRLGSGDSGFTASAVAGDGKLYYTSESGEVFVVKAGPAPEVLATNDLGEVAMATPALSEGALYFRTRRHLIAVGSRPAASPAASPGKGSSR